MATTLIDALRKVYSVNVQCENCNEFMELKIPKGIPIAQYIEQEAAKCENCGCAMLKQFKVIRKKDAEEKDKSL